MSSQPVSVPAGLVEVVVKSIHQAAEGIRSIELLRLGGGDLPAFTAGSHIDVHLPNGMVRSYSLTNPQDQVHRYTIAVSRDAASSGGSQFIHDELSAGQRLFISQPRNNFPLVESEQHSVFIAGGIGITPIWSMIQRLAALGRSWELHYACRTRASAAFLDSIRATAASSKGSVTATFDHEPARKRLDLSSIVADAPEGSHFYCCGPKGMLEAYAEVTACLPGGKVSAEYFAAPASVSTASGSFTVVLARKGVTLTVKEGATILETLLQNGIKHNYSCTQGICGSCETGVLEGIPDHQDWILSSEKKASNRTMLICCSGSKTERLVLDI